MLACARIGAPHNVVFGGFSPEAVRERMEFSEASPGHHRRRRRRARRTRIKSGRREDRRPLPRSGRFVVRHTGEFREMQEGATSGFTTHSRPPMTSASPSPSTPSIPLRPLHLRLDGEAERRAPHHGRLPGRGRLHPPLHLRPGRVGRLLVRRRRRLGDRALLHRLRAARQRRHQRPLRGRPDYPDRDIWWEIVERYSVTILYTAPTAIREPAQVGARASGKARSPRCGCSNRGRADQPEGVALVLRGDRRRARSDRRHLVADRDRPHPDQLAARPHRGEADR